MRTPEAYVKHFGADYRPDEYIQRDYKPKRAITNGTCRRA